MVVDGKPDELKNWNKQASADNVALTTVEGVENESMQVYKVNPEAKSTVFVYKNRNIHAVFVDFDPAKDSAALKKAIAEVCQ